VNYYNSLVVSITVTYNLWAPSSGDHLFTCGAIYLPSHTLKHRWRKKHLFTKFSKSVYQIESGSTILLLTRLLDSNPNVLSKEVPQTYFNRNNRHWHRQHLVYKQQC